ncbi:Zn-dependent peptidase ImmA (M78 family) [Bradyrhizobium sp. LM6.11]
MVFIDDMEIRSEDEYEREADALARESLIPSDILNQINWGPETTLDDLTTLAVRARVHPCIAAGRWQKDHHNYKRFSRLIERNAIQEMFDVK